MSAADALTLRAVSKTFGSVRVLSDVHLELRRGEVTGLVGANGSGKSTLVKIITGYHEPDPGATGSAWGKPLTFPVAAQRIGVAAIHQDLGLASDMSVFENMGVSVAYGSRSWRRVKWSAERRRCREELDRIGAHSIGVEERVGDLRPADQAIVAIARAARELRRGGADGEIFILDEPTAYLSRSDAERVLSLIRRVAAEGASVIYISHHLEEVLEICDKVTVLRDGFVVETSAASRYTPMTLVTKMLGRNVDRFYPDKIAVSSSAQPRLLVSGLAGRTVKDVSFEVMAGEILGVTGLAGMGQDELPYLLAGVAKRESGTVKEVRSPVRGSGGAGARNPTLVLIPSDRLRDGLWPLATACENLSLPVLGRYFSRGRLDLAKEARRAKDLMSAFNVVPAAEHMSAGSFSGGNQQKILLAKWLQDPPSVVLLDEPTQGVDAGARHQILAMLQEVAATGAAVVLFSADLEQVAEMCTRVLVLHRGRLAATVEGVDVTETLLLEKAQGKNERPTPE